MRIDATLGRGFLHQHPNDEVPQQQAVQLLHHAPGCLAPQHRTLSLMSLQFINGLFLLPPFMVKDDQSRGRIELVVKQRRQQPMGLPRARATGIVECVLDDPHQDAVTILLPIGWAGVDLGQIRTIVQHSNRLENQVRFDPGQEMSPTLEHLADGLVTQEIAIPQQEHIFWRNRSR